MKVIDPQRIKKRVRLALIVCIAFVFVSSFIGSFFVIVGPGMTGVQSLFGKVQDREFSSGFHFKNPFVRVTQMSIRTEDYTMSQSRGEGVKYDDDAITVLTREGLEVNLDITVLYRLIEEKASDVYRDIGLNYAEKVIRPSIRSIIREVMAEYEAKDIYSEKRQEATQVIAERLTGILTERGIELEEVLVRNVELPTDLAASIQQKLQAEQDAERYDFLLETEQKEAERKRIEAEGQRDAQAIINQSLTPRYIQFRYIESLKDREGTIYVPTDPNNGVPLFRGV